MQAFLHDIVRGYLDGTRTTLTTEEALRVCALPSEDNGELLHAAALVRALRGPAGTGTCAILNARSGRCPENCAFCAQSAHYETGAPVHPLVSTEELLAAARKMDAHGIGRFGIVTSGTTLSDRDVDALCGAAVRLRAETKVALCASLGLLDREKAGRLREAGFRRYHHNLETARSFFSSICTTHDYEEDVETLKVARAEGLEVCSCGIFGLGESWAQRVELLETVRDLEVDSLAVNFLNPVPGTPLGSRNPLEPAEALRCVALARLINPSRDIVVCGGRLTTLGPEHSWVLAAGASALMTGDYLTTRGCGYEDDDALLRALGTQRR